MTVFEILNWATHYLKDHCIENPRLNAELLMVHSLQGSRESLYTRLKEPLGEEERDTFERLVRRRISGEPLQYILGKQEFWSIDLKVDRRCFIPRPETEFLVEETVSILSRLSSSETPRVLEIGTGSGAIAIALAKEMKEVLIVATDLSREALTLAKENATQLGLLSKIRFLQANLFEPFYPLGEKGPFSIILSNPPYISRPEIERLSREVKDFEPLLALDGGDDGLDVYRKIISQAPDYLKEEGWLLLEVGKGQADEVSELIERSGGFKKPERVKDLAKIERVVKAKRKV
ncbi:MAG: peptide chain release factor N(5)-glutamine methyltransferase [Thermodesulfobacteriota bacterium]